MKITEFTNSIDLDELAPKGANSSFEESSPVFQNGVCSSRKEFGPMGAVFPLIVNPSLVWQK